MAEQVKRIAVMLDLGAGFERHTKLFSGILPFAQSRNWSVVIDEYADDTLSRCSRNARPYDGIIARATTKLADQARRLKLPVVNVWQNSPARDQLPGVYPDFELCGHLRAEHLLQRGLRQFGALTGKSSGHMLNLQGFTRTLLNAPRPMSPTHLRPA